ncbi:succinate dehydrogenase or fumarate reductase, flavoprotein subunit [Heliomicrobium modesticaldum Ice1]|uniref:succinate dehydrogenase n=1 Tax=Heliobacterium modesticaldum (strain ATCC 51547 / Ice1) TaxID=498761 RepID=B0TF08_HELMI|nr:succinate dehydrogenase flavoprotein subunit [Heliomicrobium modesticaldum]ABZ82991.1 succinate dehydrogenase or fumarate reductase, flavoprotein subunit [Heliomicrobium modesticaldum Ice1]
METRIIVVGGGLAGLMAAIKICEAGGKVDLFSLVSVKRSHSVCAQGGINGAVNTKGEGDSPYEHFDDTVYGGDFLANQPPVKAMCDAAPGIIYMMDRMGVMFNRTPEGLLDFRRFGGTKHHRTAFAGATTGQQLLYALDEQVRKWEAAGRVTKYENWDYLSAVIDGEGICRGIVAQDMASMEIRAFRGDAVILATGGIGMIFGRSTNSTINTGSPQSSAYQQGVYYANGEMIQVHPTAIPGEDKLRLMSESARGEGGRVWTYKDGKPWYFLEEWYPAYGNLVPRDVATRAIHKVCYELGLGIDGKPQVYLDLSHIDAKTLDRKLGGILEIYEKFVGDDPRKVPMKIFPGMHYTMGGLWTDYNGMTNIPGLFASGEAEYQYHGANRLGANSLLSAIFGGMVSGPATMKYVKGLKKSAADVPQSVFDQELKRQQAKMEEIYRMSGTENPYKIHEELGNMMLQHVTIVRINKDLKATDNKLQELMARWKKIGLPDSSRHANQSAIFTRHLWNMLELARVITIGALNRNESRGAHYKPEFPNRDDENFLKTTKAKWTAQGPVLEYEDVDVSLIKPRPRRYDVDKGAN